jgi:hypothetical protein
VHWNRQTKQIATKIRQDLLATEASVTQLQQERDKLRADLKLAMEINEQQNKLLPPLFPSEEGNAAAGAAPEDQLFAGFIAGTTATLLGGGLMALSRIGR